MSNSKEESKYKIEDLIQLYPDIYCEDTATDILYKFRLFVNTKTRCLVIVPCNENKYNRGGFKNYGYWNMSITKAREFASRLVSESIDLEMKTQ